MSAANEPAAPGQAQRFLRALFGPVDPYRLLIWTLVDKQSHWVGTPTLPGGADPYAGDIYFGLGLVTADVAESKGQRSRARANDVAAIPGVWADIDVAGEGHEQEYLPPDTETAFKILEACDFKPTIVVHTGGGLHAYWVFDDLWNIEADDERDLAKRTVEGWQRHVQAKAWQAGGYTVDSTFDLSRVLRVPGTYNHKSGMARDVTLLEEGGPVVEGDLIAAYATSVYSGDSGLAEDEGSETNVASIDLEGEDLTLSELQALHANIDGFTEVWERKTPVGDTSPSSYDMSIANYGVRAGFTDSKIAALIRHHRAYHNDSSGKADRDDYLKRTIAKARDGSAPPSVDQAPGEDAGTQEKLGYIGAAIGLTVEGVKHYSDGTWTLKIAAGQIDKPRDEKRGLGEDEVEIGSIGKLMNQARFREVVYEQAQKLMTRYKNEQWDTVLGTIKDVAQRVDAGEHSDERDQVAKWLTDYLTDNTPILDTDEQDVMTAKIPYRVFEDGDIYFWGNRLREHIELNQGERVDGKQLGRMLRRIGCRPDSVYFDHPETGKRAHTSVWRLPASVAQRLGAG